MDPGSSDGALGGVGDDDGGLRIGAASDDGEDGFWRFGDEGVAAFVQDYRDVNDRDVAGLGATVLNPFKGG